MTLKGLFVTHNYGLYGASQSLQLLLKIQSGIDASLFIPKKKIISRSASERIARRFGIRGSNLKQFFLPWINCFEGRKTDLRNRILVSLKNILWWRYTSGYAEDNHLYQ